MTQIYLVSSSYFYLFQDIHLTTFCFPNPLTCWYEGDSSYAAGDVFNLALMRGTGSLLGVTAHQQTQNT